MSASSPYHMLAVCAGSAVAGLSIWWASKKLVTSNQDAPPASETQPPKKKLREVLLERGVQAAKISMGCVLYELLGVGFLVGSWAFCWLVQPTKILQSVLPNLDGSSLGRLQGMFSQAAEKAGTLACARCKMTGNDLTCCVVRAHLREPH